MWKRPAGELLAMLMIGDGMVGIAYPRGHAGVWLDTPLKCVAKPFVEHPQIVRVLSALELAAGFWLVAQQTRGLRMK